MLRVAAKHAGAVIETTQDEPRAIVLGGSTSVLPRGLEIAICSMHQGEKAKFELQGGFAPFGEEGLPQQNIPPHASVEYEVELLSWIAVIVLKDGAIIIKPVVTPPPTSKPVIFDMVKIRYSGRVASTGAVFVNEGFGPNWEDGPDSTVVARKVQLKGIVPDALRLSLAEMWKGCCYLVSSAPQYAFGPDDVQVLDKVIPGGSRVEFKVDFCDHSAVQDLTGDGGVLLELLSTSQSIEVRRPTEGCTCTVSYQSAVQGDAPQAGRQFESHLKRFVTIGQADSPLTDGLERALQAMSTGEAGMVRVSPDYAYGDEPFQGSQACVPPGTHVEHRVSLLDFKPAGRNGIKTMSFEEQILFAKSIKDVGNTLFKSGTPTRPVYLRRAICRYEAVDRLLAVPDHRASAPLTKEASDTRNSALVNIAACHLQLKNWRQCVAACNQVLKNNACHSKALYRRALAKLELGHLLEAEGDVRSLLSTEPSDKAVQMLSQRLNKMMKEGDKKSVFNNMFAKC